MDENLYCCISLVDQFLHEGVVHKRGAKLLLPKSRYHKLLEKGHVEASTWYWDDQQTPPPPPEPDPVPEPAPPQVEVAEARKRLKKRLEKATAQEPPHVP